jgi:ureidoglycolate dehydrogenase (NAD+)
MARTDVRVQAEPLKRFTKDVFVRLGMPERDAETEADVLVWANLRGVDSHGVLRLWSYTEAVGNGYMNPSPNIKVAKETPATILVDANRAFGPVVTVFTMKRIVEKAKNIGVGWGFIRATSHQGAMGYYSLMAANEGMIGISLVCGPPNMAVFGARAAGVSNSPLAISVPAKKYRPLILDMATSVAAGGKLMLAIDKGIPIPSDWALDREGNPTTDPKKARDGGVMLPFGGPKGSGLALMMETMASIIVENDRVGPVLKREVHPREGGQNSIVAAIDISTFTSLERYKEGVDKMIEGVKALPKAPGVQEIFLPGEPEWRVYDERSRNGIPLPPGTVETMKKTAQKLEIKWPFEF